MVKRSKFWTVVFSFLPGAGHMFMGFVKQGTSIMITFFGLIAVSSWLGIGELGLLAPVLWFYAFFDCINKRFSTDVAFMQFEDKILFEDWFKSKEGANLGRYNTIISVLLIMVGATWYSPTFGARFTGMGLFSALLSRLRLIQYLIGFHKLRLAF